MLCAQVSPEFPTGAVSNAVSGMVHVKMDVRVDGYPDNVVVVKSYPRRIFDRAAIKSVEQWRFTPKLINGEPVADFNFNYVLSFHYGGMEPTTSEQWIDSLRLSLQNLKCIGGSFKEVLPCHSKINKRLESCLEEVGVPRAFDVVELGDQAVHIGAAVFECVDD